jgi:2,3-bisphosphoglycerate-independent phosphoglycerate mutase
VAGGTLSSDGTKAYSEPDAAGGALGRLKGVEVLPMLVEMARA